jgi:hypothetical protein
MANKATAAKPAAESIGGGIAFAPIGTTLPTAANTQLAAGFKNAGYISNAGVTRAIGIGSTTINAWGGAVAAVLSGSKTETFKFRVINAYEADFLKMVFGDAAGSLDTGLTVTSNSAQQEAHAWVITMLEVEGNGHRIVVPNGIITEIGEIVYVDNDVVGYEITITAIGNDNGDTAYDYYAKAASGSGSN